MQENLLPFDGEVYYFGKIMEAQAAQIFYDKLFHQIDWKNDEAYIFGKHFVTKRKVAWYGDHEFEYTYSKITKKALKWTAELHELKLMVEKYTGAKYNSCLCNLYHNGEEGMAWHSDDEKKIEKNSSIASLTFGATRKFGFKHKTKKNVIPIVLESGSLLEMKGTTQTFWWHRLPKTKLDVGPRINLTFRLIVE